MRHRNPGFLTPHASSDEESDPEDSIRAVPPQEHAFHHVTFHNLPSLWERVVPLVQDLRQGKLWWTQWVTITIAALLTYSYAATTNVQVAIMTVITLAGATSEPHLLPAAIGAFVGGHNNLLPPNSYLWVMLLSVAVGALWSFGMVPYKILDGYAGRLGTTTFIGGNLVLLLILCPVGIVDWNKYYYGFLRPIHMAEDDPMPLSAAWSWTEELQVAIGYTLSVVWLTVIAGATRLYAPKDIKLNNVLVPCLWALLCILVVNATGYQHAPALYNGFAVGAYVAMAKIDNLPRFAMAGLLAALWGLTLTPFFVGFAGKSGFTSMMGHATYNIIEAILLRRQRQQQQQAQQTAAEQQQQQQPNPQPVPPPTSPQQSRSIKQPKGPYYTKQQRRQLQRLQSQQQELEQQQQSNSGLHHRAWSAVPHASSSWQHPLDSTTTTSTAADSTSNEVV